MPHDVLKRGLDVCFSDHALCVFQSTFLDWYNRLLSFVELAGHLYEPRVLRHLKKLGKSILEFGHSLL